MKSDKNLIESDENDLRPVILKLSASQMNPEWPVDPFKKTVLFGSIS